MKRRLRYAHDTLRLFIDFFQAYDNDHRKHVENKNEFGFSNKQQKYVSEFEIKNQI